MATLSAIVIAKNAADTIARTLNSLSFTHEVIVIIDEQSTDATEEIVRRFPAKVFKRAWAGYGPQKNFGAAQATGGWLLFVDADEEVTSQLATEIRSAISNPNRDVYWLRVVTYFLGRPLEHLYGHNPRLFKKTAAKWTDSFVHEQVEHLGENDPAIVKLGDNRSDILQSSLLHYSHQSIRSYLGKMHTYTTLDAKEMIRTSRHRSGRRLSVSFFLPYRLAIRQFIKLYGYRRGFLDGWAGLVWCALSSYYEYEMANKFLKMTNEAANSKP